MIYAIDSSYNWGHDCAWLCLTGTAPQRVGRAGWTPSSAPTIGAIPRSRQRKAREDDDCLEMESGRIRIYPNTSRWRLLTRRVGWIATQPAGFVEIVDMRKPAVAGVICALLAATLFLAWALTGVNPADAPSYFADQVGLARANPASTAEISYATYQSTPDSVWKSGTTSQRITLSLPAETVYEDAEGNKRSQRNPVDAAPSIWVDLDGDGSFSSGECVFNPPVYNSRNAISNPGMMLRPGKELREIELTRSLPKGSYVARMLWTPVSTESHEPANPMSFTWNLEVI